VSKSHNVQRLSSLLSELGHTRIKVWWERLRGATEMCGQGGGWFFYSKERGTNHLGNNVVDARANARHWHRVQ